MVIVVGDKIVVSIMLVPPTDITARWEGGRAVGRSDSEGES
jgi:hypothetical protein